MKLASKIAATLAVLALASTANAAMISGLITFGGGNGVYTAGNTGILNITTQPTVTFATGNFVPTIGQTAIFKPFNFTSGALNDLWTVGGFEFDLTSMTQTLNTSLTIATVGTGMLSGNGFQATPGTFEFSANPGTASQTFSFTAATQAVPDGGATFALLGLSLLGVGGVSRFVRRK